MTRTGKLQPAYKGVAKMALASQVDIIPTVIESYHVYAAHHKWPRFNQRCRIKFLEPIKYERIKNMDPEHIVHKILMPEIAKELGHEYLS
jgi:1-acyl-sn-glycerol-3-phosphate acyltransferase